MDKCIVYVRVSDPSQVDGTSLDTQTEKCREYADRNGWKVEKVFREEGVSAKVWQRPEFMKALEFIKQSKNSIQYVVVYTIDRISRNLEDQFIILKSFRDAGAELRSVAENIDSSPSGQLIRNVLWAVAEFDNKMRAEKCYNGSKARFMQGYWTHNPPAGYRMVRDPITKRSMATLIPEQAPHIKWAFEQRAKGWTFNRIADGMNTRGYRTKMGRKMTGSRVEEMLKHPFYMGTMKSYGLEVEGLHEPIVSKELWHRAQLTTEANHVNNKVRTIINPIFPLKATALCPACGRNFTGSSPRGKQKNYSYYHHGNRKCVLARNISKEEMEQAFRQQLMRLKAKPKYHELAKAVILEVWREKLKGHVADQDVISKKISDLKNEKATLLELKRKNPSLYTDEEFIQQKKEIDEQVYELEHQLTDKKDTEQDFEEALDTAFKYVSDPCKAWDEFDYENKVRLQRIIFPEGIEFDGTKFGTPKLSLIIEILEAAKRSKSEVVDML